MVYRISEESEGRGIVLHVDGELDATAARTLERRLARIGTAVTSTSLDLSQTRHADTDGAAFLHRARRQGVELRGASHFITELLTRLEAGTPAAKGGNE